MGYKVGNRIKYFSATPRKWMYGTVVAAANKPGGQVCVVRWDDTGRETNIYAHNISPAGDETEEARQ